MGVGEQEGVRGAWNLLILVIVSSTGQPHWSRRAGALSRSGMPPPHPSPPQPGLAQRRFSVYWEIQTQFLTCRAHSAYLSQ